MKKQKIKKLKYSFVIFLRETIEKVIIITAKEILYLSYDFIKLNHLTT
jgi:hypothetical protein